MLQLRTNSKWVILATLAVVVASFLGASGYAEYRARRVHNLTAEIATRESPSIMHLAAARAELRDLQRLLSTAVLLDAGGQPARISEIEEVRARLRSSLAASLALPSFGGGEQVWPAIDKELAEVDLLAGRILEESSGGRHAVARALLVERLPPAIDEAAEAIMGAITRDADRVRQVAQEIERQRRSRTLWVMGLDAVSVGLAVVLALLALRSLSRHEALQRRRSEELEGFAGRVAHDLLNPIAAAEMAMAAGDLLEPARRETALARARRSLGRARRLIDDLLAFAQGGARPVPGAVTDVAPVLEGVAEELRAPAQERGITLDIAPLSEPVAVACASGVLSSLLSNLVRNSIKHMDDRPLREVHVRVSRRGDQVRFEVEDTGPGLPAALLSRAFDPYVRGLGTTQPGLGLGLATVRRLVEGHDGRYGLRSHPGAGALFWFELAWAANPARDDAGDGDGNDQESLWTATSSAMPRNRTVSARSFNP